MTKAQHTPAPWVAKDSKYRSSIRSGSVTVAHCDQGSDSSLWPNSDQRQANARLIAAAPELLAALEGMLANLPSIGKRVPVKTKLERIAAARTAINKAKGE